MGLLEQISEFFEAHGATSEEESEQVGRAGWTSRLGEQVASRLGKQVGQAGWASSPFVWKRGAEVAPEPFTALPNKRKSGKSKEKTIFHRASRLSWPTRKRKRGESNARTLNPIQFL